MVSSVIILKVYIINMSLSKLIYLIISNILILRFFESLMKIFVIIISNVNLISIYILIKSLSRMIFFNINSKLILMFFESVSNLI